MKRLFTTIIVINFLWMSLITGAVLTNWSPKDATATSIMPEDPQERATQRLEDRLSCIENNILRNDRGRQSLPCYTFGPDMDWVFGK